MTVKTLALFFLVIGAMFAFGGVLSSWRYGHGLGATAYKIFRGFVRYGLIAVVVGAVLLGLSALLDVVS